MNSPTQRTRASYGGTPFPMVHLFVKVGIGREKKLSHEDILCLFMLSCLPYTSIIVVQVEGSLKAKLRKLKEYKCPTRKKKKDKV